MTIFQKMILVPVLSLFFYGGYITYTFVEYQHNSKSIKTIRDDYIPVMELLRTNIELFKQLNNTFKETILAQEPLWLLDAKSLKTQIKLNLNALDKYPLIIKSQLIEQLNHSLDTYYNNSNVFAEKMLKRDELWLPDDATIHRIEHSLQDTSLLFSTMSTDVKINFLHTIDNINKAMEQLLFVGSILTVVTIILLITVTFYLSISTRNSFKSIVDRTKLIASGEVDFSKRLSRGQNDELGVLIHWFNKLSDKLEVDHIKLRKLSITDKLTQLNNRTRTDQFLPPALLNSIESEHPLVLVILDIDYFKKVNDNYGHLVGDNVLTLLADTLKKDAKNGDYLSRWGGEEFLLVWQNIPLGLAINKANKIRESIANTNFPEVGTITVSIGLTIALKTDNVHSLIARADSHLYLAKTSGRNCVIAQCKHNETNQN